MPIHSVRLPDSDHNIKYAVVYGPNGHVLASSANNIPTDRLFVYHSELRYNGWKALPVGTKVMGMPGKRSCSQGMIHFMPGSSLAAWPVTIRAFFRPR